MSGDEGLMQKRKLPKYRNRKVYVYTDGVRSEKTDDFGALLETYDSVAEYRRGQELLEMERAGLIKNLTRQEKMVIQDPFVYQGKKQRAVIYTADFKYLDCKTGNTVVEDVKGFDRKKGKYRTTEIFTLKWKMLKYRYPNVVFLLSHPGS